MSRRATAWTKEQGLRPASVLPRALGPEWAVEWAEGEARAEAVECVAAAAWPEDEGEDRLRGSTRPVRAGRGAGLRHGVSPDYSSRGGRKRVRREQVLSETRETREYSRGMLSGTSPGMPWRGKGPSLRPETGR